MNQDKKIIDFAVYILGKFAAEKQITTPEAYAKLNSVGAIDDYLIPFYDVLHTQGTQSLVADLTEYAQLRGVEI
jgi:hypothetical protein